MAGSANLALAEGDEVLVLGAADIAFLASPPVQRALRGEAQASYWVEFTVEVVEALPPDGAEGRARLLLFAKSSFC
jgi:hypothetical protein